ncbi:hypothetical protein HYPP_00153 [Hyphomicrobium sp. ghe19]|nr:hypothetical protein HYPP_00153 [Hyphomicrobium sp. ghe19]
MSRAPRIYRAMPRYRPVESTNEDIRIALLLAAKID